MNEKMKKLGSLVATGLDWFFKGLFYVVLPASVVLVAGAGAVEYVSKTDTYSQVVNGYAEKCVDGVTYLTKPFELTPKVDLKGKPVPCSSK